MDVQVALHFPLGGDQRGVTAVAGAKLFDLIGYLAVQEPGAVGAGQAGPPSQSQVDDSRAAIQSGVFRGGVSVVSDHFPAVQLLEAGVQSLMKLMQSE